MRKRQLKWQMMLIIIFVILSIIILLFFVFENIKKIIVEQYSNGAVQSVSAVAKNMDYILQDVENQTNSILLNREIIEAIKNGDSNKSSILLNSYYISSFYIEALYIVQGDVQWQIGAQIDDGQNKGRMQYLEGTKGEIIWIPTRPVQIQILSGEIGRNYFSLGRKIIDVDTLQNYGYLFVELNEESLKENYVELADEKSDVLIINKDGELISGVREGLPLDYVREICEKEGAGSFEFREEGIDYVSIYAPFNRGEWKMVKTVPKQILYGEVEILHRNLMIISIIVCLLFLILIYLYFEKITEPITKMMIQMKAVEQGDLTVKVDTNYTNEFGQLGESFNHMVGRVDGLMQEIVVAERSKKEMELELLHAQINPHFLYNTLSTIRFMAKFKGEDSISSAIVALTKLLRVSINLGKDMIPLDEEISYVQNYLLIQRLRFNQRFDFDSTIQPSLKKILLPKLILQPIVENALLYGVEDVGDKILQIRIFTEEIGDKAKIVVEDNGPGMTEDIIRCIFRDEKNINKFSTVGLNNVNQRIKIYCGENYGIRIDSKPDAGTRIIIMLPNNSEKEC